MGPRQKLQIVDFVKLVRHALSKQIPGPPRRELPGSGNVLGIAPHQIVKGALVGNFLVSVNRPHLIQSANIGAETSVHAKDFFVNESRQAKAVKALNTVPPDAGVSVFSQALVVKAVDLCDLSRLQRKLQKLKNKNKD